MKILTILGARPQFVKSAVISRALRGCEDIQEVLVHTGQHFDHDMSGAFFNELDIPTPSYNLKISGGIHGQMTGRMLESVEQVIIKERPQVVLVYGDTNSTLAGGLAAVKLHIPIAHVEAGLRSFNRQMPEEINRILVDHVSELLFCPTLLSVENLRKEGIVNGVHSVGDVMFDATRFASNVAKKQSDILERLSLRGKSYALCTVHRAENTDSREALNKIFEYLNSQSSDYEIILPLHPRTNHALKKHKIDTGKIRLISPLGYLDMHRMLQSASAVFTDSGGLQKEAYFHRVPCITLRSETEWVETIDAGWNRLWSVPQSAKPRSDITDYGDGDSASKIISILKTIS